MCSHSQQDNSMAESTVSMKLLINTQSNRVLFAEAGKDCVDFLFHILSLPLATVITLLKEQGMVGSLGKLYDSIENLNESYLQPNQSKTTILMPARPRCDSFVPLALCNNESTGKLFWRCSKCPYNHSVGGFGSHNQQMTCYVTDDQRAICPSCKCQMTTSVTYVAPPAVAQKGPDEGGFVKGVVTYMVMDNLEVKPMSTISSITLLNRFEIKDVGTLEERVVKLSMTEAIKLLKASLQSDHVLTDVFMKDTKRASAY